MSFCRECGVKLEENPVFCSECGTKVSDGAPIQTFQPHKTEEEYSVEHQPVQSSIQPPVYKRVKKLLTKKQKIVFGSIAGFVLILIISFFVLQKFTGLDYTLENFETALNDKDVKTLSNMMESSDRRAKLEDKHIKDFIAYLDENPSVREEVMSYLKSAAKSFENGKHQTDDGYFLQLKKDGKSFLFFDHYQIQIRPYYVNIYTNYEGAKLLLDGKEIGEATEDDFYKQFGPYIPGKYKFEAVLDEKYGKLKTEQEINLYDSFGSNEVEVDLALYGDYIDIETGFADSEVFINGESVGETDEYGYLEMGPISLDGSFKLHAEKTFPWGKGKSDEVMIEEDYYYELMISPLNEELEKNISTTLKDFEVQLVEAYRSMDASKITTGAEEVKVVVGENISQVKESKTKYVGVGITEVTINLDSIEIVEDDEYYAYALGMITEVGALVPGDVSGDELKEYENHEETYALEFYLTYDNASKKWLVVESYDSWEEDFGEGRVETFKVQ